MLKVKGWRGGGATAERLKKVGMPPSSPWNFCYGFNGYPAACFLASVTAFLLPVSFPGTSVTALRPWHFCYGCPAACSAVCLFCSSGQAIRFPCSTRLGSYAVVGLHEHARSTATLFSCCSRMLPEKMDQKDEDAVHQASAGYRARPWPPHVRQHMLQSGPYFIWDLIAFVFFIIGGL